MYSHTAILRRSILCVVTVMCLCLAGCATYSGVPTEPINLDEVNKKFQEDLFNNVTKVDTINISKDERNDLINKAVTLIDLRYSQFVNNLGRQRRTKDVVVDVTELSLNIAGTAVGSAATKTVLAAISAGITGSNSVIDKEFFYDMALPSLIARMNADRTEVYLRIVTGMTRNPTGDNAYLWMQALRDLVDYYHAGTLQHAAFSVIKEAGAKQQEDENIIKDEILFIPQKADTQSVVDREKLTDSLRNISADNLADVKKILVPLSHDLADLPECQALEVKANGGVKDIKRALQACIQDVSTSKRPFKDDHAKIANRFKEAGILAQ